MPTELVERTGAGGSGCSRCSGRSGSSGCSDRRDAAEAVAGGDDALGREVEAGVALRKENLPLLFCSVVRRVVIWV